MADIEGSGRHKFCPCFFPVSSGYNAAFLQKLLRSHLASDKFVLPCLSSDETRQFENFASFRQKKGLFTFQELASFIFTFSVIYLLGLVIQVCLWKTLMSDQDQRDRTLKMTATKRQKRRKANKSVSGRRLPLSAERPRET